MIDPDYHTPENAEVRLNKLLENYLRREPYRPVVLHALRETFKERFPNLAENYDIRIKWYWQPGDAEEPSIGKVTVFELSAVDRLARVANPRDEVRDCVEACPSGPRARRTSGGGGSSRRSP